MQLGRFLGLNRNICTPVSLFPPALSSDGKDALQRGRCDAQPLGDGNVVFHAPGDNAPAYHQNMGAPQQVAAYVNAVFMLLGYGIMEKVRQEQHRADGGIARLIDSTAIPRRPLHIFHGIVLPGSGDVRKVSLHGL